MKIQSVRVYLVHIKMAKKETVEPSQDCTQLNVLCVMNLVFDFVGWNDRSIQMNHI